MTTASHRRPAAGRAPRRGARRLVTVLAAGALALGPAVAAAQPAAAADGAALAWSAALGNHDIGAAGSNSAIRLDPALGTLLVVNMRNTGTTPIAVKAAVLEGRVIGLPFFNYRTRLDVVLPPGRSAQRTVELDLSDLGDQATGLIPTRVQLLGDTRQVLASRSFVTDVRGRSLSVYGIFGLVIAVVTLLMLIGLAITLTRGRLPENRWQRAMQFLPAGIGVGFVATFTLSATRILAPSATLWVPLVLGCAAVAFVLGYLAPGPDAEDDTAPLPRQRGRRAAATGAAATAAVGVGGVAAIFGEHQADAAGAGGYDDGPMHGDVAPH